MNILTDLYPFFFIMGYLGPETIMPLASILAAIIGVILIFWRFILGSVKKIFRKGQSEDEESPIETMAITAEDKVEDDV